MITLTSKNFDFGSPYISEIVVLGHAAFVKKFDLGKYQDVERSIFGFTLNLKDREGSLTTAKKKGIEPFVVQLMDVIIPSMGNCGDDEQDYITALRSPDEGLRILLALNGKCLEVLSEDNSRRVRRAVLRNLTYLKKYNYPTGDLSWLDPMVEDSCEFVRRYVAKIAIKEHLDRLINDKSNMVLEMVARKGDVKHIGILLARHKQASIREHLAFNPNATDEQLRLIAREGALSVLLVLAQRGFAADEVVFSEFTAVRTTFVKNCDSYMLEQFINDSDSLVRVEVAWRGIGLDILQFDNDEAVRLAVNGYKENLIESA